MKKDTLKAIGLMLVALAVIFVPVVLLAQETVAPDAGGAPAPMAEVVSTQLVASYLLSWLLQKIKQAKSIPFFEEGAKYANSALAWVFAAAQTIGLGMTFDTAAGTLMITGLTFPSIIEFARAYVVQKLMYVWALRPQMQEAGDSL